MAEDLYPEVADPADRGADDVSGPGGGALEAAEWSVEDAAAYDISYDGDGEVAYEDAGAVASDEDGEVSSDVADDADRTVAEDPDTGASGGEAGEEPDNTPPEEQEPVAEAEYVEVEQSTDYIIDDYSAEALAAHERAGARAIAVLEDGTELEVAWSEVFDPRAVPVEVAVANEAAWMAEATNQHFWSNSDDAARYGGAGVHVTDDEKDAWVDAVAGGFPGLGAGPGKRPWHNILMNSLGILLRSGLNNLVSISKSAIAFFDGSGNAASNVVARFGRDGAQIGRLDSQHAVIDTAGLSVYNADGTLAKVNTVDLEGVRAATAQAKADAATAKSAAESAVTGAAAAKGAAQSAQADAADAKSAAQSAQSDAASAKATADGIAATAQQAQADAADAKSAAESAISDAADAKSAAQGAQAFADAAAQSASGAASSASSASASASSAAQSAQSAISEASAAKSAAGEAKTAAVEAMGDAAYAKQDAARANTAANSALTQLSTVEDVLGALEWVAEHGEYEKTADTAIKDGKVYYARSGSGTDASPYVYTAVSEPKASDLSAYYELEIDEALSAYVASHLTLTDAGLYVLNDSTSYKVLLSATGMQVQDAEGNAAATYGADGTSFSALKPYYVGNEDAYILFAPASGSKPASITIGGGNVLIGTNRKLSDVLTSLDISTAQTASGATITVGGRTVTLANGRDGAKGDKGDKGDAGVQGPQGEKGDTPSITATKSGSTTTIKADGAAIATISDGAAGASSYSYVRYSANANGASMTEAPTSATQYVGFYSGTSATCPAHTAFKWSKYVGADGADAASNPLVKGTQAAATRWWTGVAETLDSLEDGQQIVYWLPYGCAASAPNANTVSPAETGTSNLSYDYLQLTLKDGTKTAWVPCFYGGTARLTTHYGANNAIPMTYRRNAAGFAEGWWAASQYNTDTQNRTRWQNVIRAAGAGTLTSGRIICGTASGYRNIAAGVSFDLSYPLLYAGTTQNASGGTTDNNFLQINGINASNNGTIESAAQYTALYLKGTVSGNTFKVAASPFLTCKAPTSDDGFCYIPLGMLYNSTTNIYFNSSKELYAYRDGMFGPVSVREASAAAKLADAAQTAANTASTKADTAKSTADTAKSTADTAKSTAEAANSAAIDARKVATNYIATVDNGIMVHPEGDETSGWKIADALELLKSGIAAFRVWLDNGMAKMQIGESGKSHIELDYHSLRMVSKEGDPYLYVSDLRDTSGTVEITEEMYGSDSVFTALHQVFQLSYEPTAIISLTVNGQTASYTWPYTRVATRFKTENELDETDLIEVKYKTRSIYAKAFTFGSRASSGYVGGSSAAFGQSVTASGLISHAEGFQTEASDYCSHAEGFNSKATGNCSHAEGGETTASKASSHSEGYKTTASGIDAHAEGWSTVASGQTAHAEGFGTKATGAESHAEGNGTIASGMYSHAEGDGTTASEFRAHAEGQLTEASGLCSHAEGVRCKASGSYSHAQNCQTIASSDYQTVLGKYNVEDADGKYAVIVGNGTSGGEARSNAAALKWDGALELASALPVASGGTGKATHTANAVLTGNGASAVNNVATASGAFYATAANGAAKFGVLPIAQGGTGQNTAAKARNALGLGDTTGALPIANGGTGATSASAALANLGAAAASHAHTVLGDPTTEKVTVAEGAVAIGKEVAGPGLDVGMDASFDGALDVAGDATVGGAAAARKAVVGQYNVEDDSGAYALIIGNGTSDEDRSNALTVEWDGDVTMGHALRMKADSDNYAALQFNSKNRSGIFARLYGADDGNGDEVVIGDGGHTVVGAGEAGPNLKAALALAPGKEVLDLAADEDVRIWAECNTVANRIQMSLSGETSGQSIGAPWVTVHDGANHKATIGTSADNGVTANTTIGGFQFLDKAGTWACRLGSRTDGAGSIVGYLGVQNKKADGTAVSNYINVIIKKDGSQTYSISSPTAFRNAIGASSGVWPVAQGGSGQSATASGSTVATLIAANTSAASVTSATYAAWGKVASVAVAFKPAADISVPATGNIANLLVGTVASAYRPKTSVNLVAADYNGVAVLGTDGKLSLTSLEGTGAARTHSKDTTITVRGTYVLA